MTKVGGVLVANDECRESAERSFTKMKSSGSSECWLLRAPSCGRTYSQGIAGGCKEMAMKSQRARTCRMGIV